MLAAGLARKRVDETPAPAAVPPPPQVYRPLSFSLFFFSDNAAHRPQHPYRLVLAAAQFADDNDFEAVWLPERHFHEFGGLYPNPSVLAAAVAATTRRVRIRAGSVVVPLHHPARVAEEWAMVDNLSGGRVDIAAASGWAPDDFALSTVDFQRRRDETFTRLDAIRALWRGERIDMRLGAGANPLPLNTFPRPIQPELAVWITTAGTPETWALAGAKGYHVLSGLLQGDLDRAAANIARYRKARADAGHDPATGRVSMMMHTFVGASVEDVRRTVRAPLLAYLETHMKLYETMPGLQARLDIDAADFSADDKAAVAEFAFERYFAGNGMFGTPETCLAMTARLQQAGVDEVACLIDFGVDDDIVLAGLAGIDALRLAVQRAASPADVEGGS
ncbi:MupA/Atu3671 family FMN-dependent luciferase-like monooxygenase [Nocardia sp. NPDC049149]|uniref:MupA/Atu3671 family FMN-dependent luciferase-like monooxygenase n=1 Tax=Nocardia sp. NPDC049149 TaxID=3364315 RepID=UPI0037168E3B